MPRPRKAQISLEATPYYHCVSRCVRKAFLCGIDKETNKDYEYRREWVEERLLELAGLFAINVAAYTVLSNHYHVVMQVDREHALTWSADEVLDRWEALYSIPLLVQRFRDGEALCAAELDMVNSFITERRRRLYDISWFMRALNEFIARKANAEDRCTGHFWEGRFRSKALLDEKALAVSMAYVDLNPIRAKMANTPEESDHTSIQRRARQAEQSPNPSQLDQQPPELLPFVGDARQEMPVGLPFHLTDYLQLVDWTGRAIRPGKRGAIAGDTPPILQRLQIDEKQWIYLSQNFESPFKGLVGAAHSVAEKCKAFGYRRTPTLKPCRTYLG